MLGRVIEKISGLPYGDYVRQLLWTVGVHRLKLAHTRRADADLSEVTAPSDSPSDSLFKVFNSISSCIMYGGEGTVVDVNDNDVYPDAKTR